MRRSPECASLLIAVAFATVALAPRAASAQEERKESAATTANRGLHLGIGPVLLIPTDGGPLGGGLDLSGRYGFLAGPTIVAPGARVASYLISERLVALGMPTLRITVPVGPLAPFVTAGVGPGWISTPGELGAAVLAGGGLLIHFGRAAGIGLEATYQTITGTDMRSVAIGPSIVIGS